MRQHKFLLAIITLLLSSAMAYAQRPAYYKMSSMVRQACREAQSGTLGSRVRAKGASKMIAFVKLTDSDYALEEHGCRVLARYGSLFIAEIPVSQIGSLSLDNRVCRIEANRVASVHMDTTGIIVNSVPVNEGVNLPQKFTGKGVVVGVQDIGFDLTHPTFWSSDLSTYRIKAMWDQLSYDTLNTTMPVGRDYVGQKALLEVGHPRDGLIQTHGTHTAGIAAGSGAEGRGVVSPYRGIASDADICLVCNATSDDRSIIAPKDYYKYTYALDALGFKYIFDYADRVGKPCVINFSEGSGMDFRGDDQLYYEMLDSLTGPGHIIVSSAGNTGHYITHAVKRSDEHSAAIGVNILPGPMVVTTRTKAKNFTLRFRRYSGSTEITRDISFADVLAAPDSTLTDTLRGANFFCPITASAYTSCYDASDMICDWQIERDSALRDGGWKLDVILIGDGQTIDLFPANCTLTNADNGTVTDVGDDHYGVNSPGSAPCVISVGSSGYRQYLYDYKGDRMYNWGWGFANGVCMGTSSVGPTFDERIKPDVLAPGQNVISSVSSFFEANRPDADVLRNDVRRFTYNDRLYGWTAMSGTSMSSPVVAGVIALWLQAYPKLTPQDCIEIFSKSCTHYDASLSYPNNNYGYGQIDAAAGIQLVLKKAAAGIEEVLGDAVVDDRIYTLGGICVGKDATRLPAGLYIRSGKKFVIGNR